MGKRGFRLALVGLFPSLLLGPASLASADSLQVNLVWEREFDFPVTDFAIGEKKTGGAYLRVVSAQSDYEDTGAVCFFDEQMRLMRKVEVPAMGRARISTIGDHVGVFHSCYMATYDGCPVGAFAMYDWQGRQLWSMDSTWCPPLFYILGRGDRIACVDDWGGVIEFYDSHGESLGSFTPFPHGPGPFTIGICGDVSLDGRFLAVNVNSSRAREIATVILLDENGKELWRTQLADSTAWDVTISEQGNTIAAVAQNPTRSAYVLDGSGTILHSHLMEGWTPFDLSGDGQVFVAALSESVVSVYSVQTGQLMWQHTNPDTTQIFTSLDVTSGEGFRVLAGATTIDPTADFWEPVTDLRRHVYLIDSSGQPVWHQEFNGAGYWSLEGPLVRFANPEGREFFVGNREKVYHYAY